MSAIISKKFSAQKFGNFTINRKLSNIFLSNNLLLFIFLLSTFNFSLFSQSLNDGNDKTESPYFFVKSDSTGVDQLPLKSTSVNVEIAGIIANVSVKQTYKNEGKSTLEAIYVFPASTRAAVYAMNMKIGNRKISAIVKEKEQARKDYEVAKQQGKTASLLEQQRPNVFQMNVANILPGDNIEVELFYTELLVPESGIYQFVYPTVVGPRYVSKSDANANGENKWVSQPYTHAGKKPTYTFNIQTKINAGLPVREVNCASHQVKIDYEKPTLVKISLAGKDAYEGNRDFILTYKLADEQIASGLMLYEGKDENFFLAMIQPPSRPENLYIPPREYIFIVDVSGSMSGFPLTISKKLLKNLISNLKQGDKFNVLLFSGGSTLMSDISVDATPENINKAIDIIDRQRGGGGTELLPALKNAMSIPIADNYSRTFVIATDGYVSIEKESFELIQQNLNKANFFAFGIGTSVNRFLIEGIAHVGMGLPFIATSEDEAERVAEKMRKYIQTPALTRINVNFRDFDVYDVEPKTIPDLLAERPILIFGKYKGTAHGSIELSGKSGKTPYAAILQVDPSYIDNTNIALKYLWARHKIMLTDDFNSASGSEAFKSQIIELGLKYNLLTKYTSFVAIDSSVRNADGKYSTVNQPLPLPEGVSDAAISHNLAFSGGSGVKPKAAYKEVDETSVKKTYEPKDTIVDTKQIYTVVDQMPQFIGGYAAMMDFIRKNMVYPETAQKKGITGLVYTTFVVNTDGTIEDIKIVRGLEKECDKEALRLIKLMDKLWEPAKIKGKNVRYQMSLPLRFPTL